MNHARPHPWWWKAFKGARRAPNPPKGPLDALFRKVEAAPLDSALCFELATALLRLGQEDEGVRYLDRAIRLDVRNVVVLLSAPELAQVRALEPVRQLLSRIRRDEQLRAYTGYA